MKVAKKLNKTSGNKPLFGEKMILAAVNLRADQLEWLRESPQGISRTLRDLIDQQMAKEAESTNTKQVQND